MLFNTDLHDRKNPHFLQNTQHFAFILTIFI